MQGALCLLHGVDLVRGALTGPSRVIWRRVLKRRSGRMGWRLDRYETPAEMKYTPVGLPLIAENRVDKVYRRLEPTNRRGFQWQHFTRPNIYFPNTPLFEIISLILVAAFPRCVHQISIGSSYTSERVRLDKFDQLASSYWLVQVCC